jgi:SAM-dependent methyltransferase
LFLNPSSWVRRWTPLVAARGRVLDLACGEGRHVRWFANRGHPVTAVDRDAQALAPLAGIAETIVADLEGAPWPLAERRFDAVVVTNYLWRPLFPRLVAALASPGLLVYESFAEGQQEVGRPARPEFLLRPGELLGLAAGLMIVAYEDGWVGEAGNTADPLRRVQRFAAIAGPPGRPWLGVPAGASADR